MGSWATMKTILLRCLRKSYTLISTNTTPKKLLGSKLEHQSKSGSRISKRLMDVTPLTVIPLRFTSIWMLTTRLRRTMSSISCAWSRLTSCPSKSKNSILSRSQVAIEPPRPWWWPHKVKDFSRKSWWVSTPSSYSKTLTIWGSRSELKTKQAKWQYLFNSLNRRISSCLRELAKWMSLRGKTVCN